MARTLHYEGSVGTARHTSCRTNLDTTNRRINVLKKYLFAATFAMAASSVAIGAQAPAQAQAQDAAKPATTITGCVYNEKDVPGRSPNVAEKAGVLEDYILAEVSASASPTGTSGVAGATGSAPRAMYKLEFVDDDKLKTMVGRRVEVTGRIDRESTDSARPTASTPPTSSMDKAVGKDQVNLAEFEVTSIKEVAGTCPAKPTK